jgi:hypothetical protein
MPIRVGGIIAAVMVALGALLPWATVSSLFGSISVSGTDGDGVFTLLCGIAIGVMFGLWKRPALIVAVVLAGISALVGIIDLVDIGRTAGELGGLVDASPGIGLFLTVLASIAALVLGVLGQAAVGGSPGTFQVPAWGVAPAGGTTLYPQAGPAAAAYPQAGTATGHPTATVHPQAGPAYPQAGPAYPQAGPAYPQAGPAYPQVPPAAPVAPAPQAAPAGWQADPYHQAQWRYWDGTRWTEHVQ